MENESEIKRLVETMKKTENKEIKRKLRLKIKHLSINKPVKK